MQTRSSGVLYHKDVFLPAIFKASGFLRLRYSQHALRAAEDDRYGKIQLPDVIQQEKLSLIEVEAYGRQVLKRVYRTRLDEQRDIVLVVQPDGFVRTVWINLRTDKHGSLCRDRYASKLL